MSGHTPGPWLSSSVLPKRSNFERDWRVRIGPLGNVLKTVGYAHGESAEEARANGVLQAAAPELADALAGLNRDERIIGWIPIIWNAETSSQEALGLVHCDEVRQALRKAGRLP